MEKITFNSAEEMLNTITGGTDLYCPEEEIYVFVYNDLGSICLYSVDKEQARELDELSFETGEYWGAFLGWGGRIIDSDEWYAKNNEIHHDYQESPIEWCKEMYTHNWVVCGY